VAVHMGCEANVTVPRRRRTAKAVLREDELANNTNALQVHRKAEEVPAFQIG